MKTRFRNMAWMLAATLVMAACSDSLDESENTGQGPLTGEGYVRVAINLPSTSGTRAFDETNDLVDGLANEYKVNTGIIAFFKAAKSDNEPDKNATFVKAYSLTSLTQQDDNADSQVSTRVTITTEAPLVGTSDQLYALVILNPNANVVSVNSTSGVLTVGGATNLTSTSTLATLQAELENPTLTDYTGTNKDHFLMTNAPLSTVAGNQTLSSAQAKILVPVTVHETKAAAEGDTKPARIYVERVVAKVTLAGFDYDEDNSEYTMTATVSTTNPGGDQTSVYNGDIVKLEGWVLTVTNNSTKLVRDVSDFSNWLTTDNENKASRFVGTNAITMANNDSYFRIYWAEDGNYDDATTTPATDFTTYSESNLPTSWNSNAERTSSSFPLYCLENTMDYGQQINNRTTSVLLKTKYRVKFYANEILPDDDRDFYICGTTPTKYPTNDMQYDSQQTILGIVSYVQKASQLTGLTLKSNFSGGIYEKSEGMKKLFNKDGNELTDEQATQIWNAVGPIKYYKGGESYYYAALIRHFSDSEANWNAGDTYALKHLGRYGVVRNNWYEININSISGPGDPEIVQPDGSSDDQAKGYINCTINVLSWAKRSQGVDL